MTFPGDDAAIRLAVFLGAFALLAFSECLWPRRVLTVAKLQRWRTNLSLMLLDTLMLRFLLPLSPVALAALVQSRGWGVFNLAGVAGRYELPASLLLLDLIIYLQHRAFHRMPLLWRCHRVHHTDLDLDVTSGNRFHPVEMLVSVGIKMSAVILVGCSPLSVLLFETVLNATSLFNHANVRIPAGIDRLLRLIVVTPDMHRVHHSVIPRETDSNFSFNLPWWDRLFGTYRAEPREGHDLMTIGLHEFRDSNELGLLPLLKSPFAPHPAGRS